VNLGGEPERDDFGLPPVDIEIPDDARELDRDMQAYYREQRAMRRQLRYGRWGSPVARDGLVLPVLAACLVLVLIAGTLLTVFAAGPGSGLQPQAAAGPTAQEPQARAAARGPGRSPAAGRPPATAVTAMSGRLGRLPDAAIRTTAGRQVWLARLKTAVLTLVPAACACAAAVRELIRQAGQARVPLYLVGTRTVLPALQELARQTGQPGQLVADDSDDVLGPYRRAGLTAVLIGANGTLSVADRLQLQPGPRLTARFLSLAGPVAPADGPGARP